MAGQERKAVSLGATPVSPSPCYSQNIDSIFTKLHNLFSSWFWPKVRVRTQLCGAALKERWCLCARKALKYDFVFGFFFSPLQMRNQEFELESFGAKTNQIAAH